MKSKILLLALTVAAFSSCTTAYKTGQTPDDVYYSPTRTQQENEDEYAEVDKYDNRQYRDKEDFYDDRFLRMKVSNRYRWNELNDWYNNDYRYSKYYGYNNSYCWCNNSWDAHSYWNNYYNPYYNNYVIINPKNILSYNKPRKFNLNTYTTPQQNGNAKTNVRSTSNTGRNNNYETPKNSSRNNDRNSGNVLRNIFGSDKSSSSSNNSSSSSSNSSSTSSNSSSSGSSGGSTKAETRKF